ncbi:MAG: hypothetical protein II797_04925, partial [Clostridia bacterium]|nr:hypothetical protein [Clostridia bacterium]
MRMRKKKNGEQRLLRVNGLLVPGLADYATIRSSFRRPDAPLFLEIGCGKGDFICEMARRNPENAYLAVERVGDVLVLAAEKYLSGNGLGEKTDQGAWKMTDGREIPLGEEIPLTDEEKGNVRFTCCDGRGLLERMPDDVLSGIYLNFSDPWPKKGNAKRRLTHPDFLRLYQRVLV